MWYDYEISRKKGIWYFPTSYLHLEEALMYAKDDIDNLIIGPKKPMSARRYKKKYSWIKTKTKHL